MLVFLSSETLGYKSWVAPHAGAWIETMFVIANMQRMMPGGNCAGYTFPVDSRPLSAKGRAGLSLRRRTRVDRDCAVG